MAAMMNETGAVPGCPAVNANGEHEVRNPLEAAASGEGASLTSRDLMKQRVDQAMQVKDQTVAAFRSKPWMTSALALTCFAVFFSLISTWQAWWHFKVEGRAALSDSVERIKGKASLFEMIACSKVKGGRTARQSGHMCIRIGLHQIAKDLDYFQKAGIVAFIFVLLALLVLLPALYTTFHMRMGSLHQMQSRLAFLGSNPLVAPALHATASVFLLIAFSCYAGIINSKFDYSDFEALVLAGLGVTDDSLRHKLFGPGFALVVVAWVFELGAAGICYFYYDEQHQGGSPDRAGAVPGSDGFPPAFTGDQQQQQQATKQQYQQPQEQTYGAAQQSPSAGFAAQQPPQRSPDFGASQSTPAAPAAYPPLDRGESDASRQAAAMAPPPSGAGGDDSNPWAFQGGMRQSFAERQSFAVPPTDMSRAPPAGPPY